MNKIRVLVVDDSAVIRNLLRRAISMDPALEIVAFAEDAYAAKDALIKFKPDIMTLDIDLPEIDGITFLKQVMSHFPHQNDCH